MPVDAAHEVADLSTTGRERALVWDEDGPRPSFSRALWRIASAEVSCGNKVQILRQGPTFFDAKSELIEQAKDSIELEAYIYHDDDVGVRVAQSLIDAAKRGVRVRLLVDWLGRWPTPKRFFTAMKKAGVEVRIFNPPGFRSWMGLLPRDHRKVLVVDGAIGVTGGVGIGEEWTRGVWRPKRSAWRDTAVRIDGPAARHMRIAFAKMWARARGRTREWRELRQEQPQRDTWLNTRFDPPALVGIVEGEPGKFRISRALQIQAFAAQKSIWLASAYFMPSPFEREALAGAARDGVDVRILVPSRYDIPGLRSIALRYYRYLLRSGVRLYEWSGEMMHAKTNVIDGRWVRIGSTDVNLLGVAINYELDAVIEDRSIGSQAQEMFLEDLERSKEIRLKSIR